MAYFEAKGRTVFSPQCSVLEPVYKMLEQYEPTIGGSQLFEDMVENYEYLDFVLRDKEAAT
jgi:hypothetical protein